MRAAAHKPVRRRSNATVAGLNQLDLFASATLVATEHSSPSIVEPRRSPSPSLDFHPTPPAQERAADACAPSSPECVPRKRIAPPPLRSKEAELRIVREADLPNYAVEDIRTVEQVLSAWPTTKALFTYVEIRQSFGVSRATVARKLKGGLIPGIAFAGERVMADGPVRRFTRDQVKFLLLCVRDRR